MNDRRHGTASLRHRLRLAVVVSLVAIAGLVLPQATASAVGPSAAATGTLTGSVLGISDDPAQPWDDPLPGVTVSVLDSRRHEVATTTTDALGDFRLEGLPSGRHRVQAARSGWLTTFAGGTSWRTADVVTVRAGTVVALPDVVVLYAEAVVTGQVLSTMDPIGGATVAVLQAQTGQVLGSVQLGEFEDTYRIGGLPAGPVKVRASKPGYETTYAGYHDTFATADVYMLVAGQTLAQSWDPMVLYLDLPPLGALHGRVLGVRDGVVTPLAGARVTVLAPSTSRVLGTALTKADGTYGVDGVRQNPVEVIAARAGWDLASVELVAIGQTTTEVPDLVLQRTVQRVAAGG